MPQATSRLSVDPLEIDKFAALAAEWWQPDGKFRPLHRLNPVRLGFLRDSIVAHYGRTPDSSAPLAGLRILDIGCGGGLVSEPLARLGATVVGVDAAAENIAAAKAHAEAGGLSIDYRHATAEELAEAGERFDLVVALEIVEHVADVDAFLAACATMVKPGGGLAMATLSRTPKAFMMAIVGAEYLLRWLPRGTHDWRRFLRPSELAGRLRRLGFTVNRLAGMVYNPLSDTWRLSERDLEVNYLLFAARDD
jgi:2-polyprenyl-6-hydroxyphenyl methylase/3-demethylubiquinone-9 3-methyltransferase